MFMSPEKPNSRKGKSWFARLTLCFFGLLAALISIVMIGSALMGAAPMLSTVSRFIGTARPFFYLIQCVLIFLLWWYWSTFVDFLVARGFVSQPKKAALMHDRNRIILMLIAIEVFVVMGFPFRYMDLS
jgi:hypothetical protein